MKGNIMLPFSINKNDEKILKYIKYFYLLKNDGIKF